MATETQITTPPLTESPHGMIVKVTNPESSAIETILVASLRKAPNLGGLIKAIDKLDADYSKLARSLTTLEAKAMRASAESDFETIIQITESLGVIEADLAKLQDNRDDAVVKFYTAGLKAAGYSAGQVDMHLRLLGPEMYPQIRGIVRTGAGVADFTVRG